MHHRPSGPPLSVRLRGAVRRPVLALSRRLRSSARRTAVAVAVTSAVTTAVLAVPVVSGPAEPSSLALDPSALSPSGVSSPGSSSAAPPESSTSAFPGTAATSSPAEDTGTGAGDLPAAPGSSTPAQAPPVAPAPTGTAPAPAPVPSPVPSPSTVPGGSSATSPSGTPSGTPTARNAPGTSASGTPSVTAPSPHGGASAPSVSAPSVSAPSVSAPVTPAVLDAEARVLALVNEQRRLAGCGVLAADPALSGVARAHSADMRDRAFFAHVNLDGEDPFERAEHAGTVARAENIARGQADPAAVVTSWMNSPGHPANILDCGLRTLGVGVAHGAGGPWWTQLFG
jgi:uncharacterized protein YkwD